MTCFLSKCTVFILLLVSNLFTAQTTSYRLLQSNLISGLIPDIDDAYGVAFLDFNQDLYPDIYITCFRNLNRLLINNGGIIPFIDRTIYSGLGGDLMQKGNTNLELAASVADYDNDGLPDLFLAGWGKTFRLFRNLGQVRFADVTPQLNLHGVVDANQGIWFDANNDGFLDLYITDEHHTNRFLMNQKNGTFQEQIWTEDFLDSATSQGAVAADFDQDGDLDLYVCNWFQKDYLLLNNGRGLFSLAHLPLPTLQKPYNSNSATAADLDNDGDLDLLIATRNGFVFYYQNLSTPKNLWFEANTTVPFYRCNQQVYGLLCEDFNNDTNLDLFISMVGENRLYFNKGKAHFTTEYDSDHHSSYSTGCAAADFDRDGDLDLLVGNKKSVCEIYLNPLNKKNYICLKTIGIKSNRSAIGTRVYFTGYRSDQAVFLGQRMVSWQAGYFSSKETQIHFGSGNFERLDAKIIFPSGQIKELNGLIPGHTYTVYEYEQPVAGILLLLNRASFLLKQRQTWYIIVLTLLLVAILLIYIQLSLKRYQFSTTALGLQFGLWFTVAIVLFIAFNARPIYIPLVAINAFSFFSLLFTFAYAEKQRLQRQRDQQFRQALQTFSQNMLQIHSEEELFTKLLAVLKTHREIHACYILKRLQKNTYLIFPSKIKVTLPFQLDQKLHLWNQAQILSAHSPDIQINVSIPVISATSSVAHVGLLMEKPNAPINREDLQLIAQIANQVAITLENIYYIEKTAHLTRQVTEARLKEKYLSQLEETNRQLDEKNRQLTRLFKELQNKEAQLIHSEKMAALGQLVAGITHEINNPVSFIYANSRALESLLKAFEKIWQELPADIHARYDSQLETIISDIWGIIEDNLQGSQAIKELVLQLKNFSRLDQADWKETSIVEGLETSLRFIKHHLTGNIKVIKDFKANPVLYCNPAQLNQVFVNLLLNAVQAIDQEGVITIGTQIQDDFLVITISDTGKGIQPQILPKIFDPFFTTKEVNQGTGLGLSISYSIIQKHNGRIEVTSTPGKGTTFTIFLPLKSKKQRRSL